MRICYLADANVQVRRVAEFFAAAGDEVHVVTARPRPIQGATVHSFAGRLGAGKPALLLGVPAARRLIRSIRPDLIHVFYATSYGLVSSFVPGPPVALSPMGTDVLISARGSRLMAAMVRRAIARAGLIFSVAPHMTRRLIELGADPARIETFPRGVDLERFRPPVSPRPGPARVVISNRRLEAVYNVEQLVRAAPAVQERFPDVAFRIYGEGRLRARLERLARGLGARSVHFLDPVDHAGVPSTLAEADIYVSCSRSDGTSVSLLEAMAAGLYPIVSDIEANRDWIADGRNGRLVPPDDPPALAAALVDALGGAVDLRAAGRANRQLIEQRASWAVNMPRMRTLCRRLAGEPV